MFGMIPGWELLPPAPLAWLAAQRVVDPQIAPTEGDQYIDNKWLGKVVNPAEALLPEPNEPDPRLR